MRRISYCTEDCDFVLRAKAVTTLWLASVCSSESKSLGLINYIFTSDDRLLAINRQYLSHDFFTDVITFDLSDDSDHIEGDIFISIDRVSDNAALLCLPFYTELHRVMVHGLLHLCGHTDETVPMREFMSQRENVYLAARPFKLSRLLSR